MPTAPNAPLDSPFSPITHASNVLETADNATPTPSMSVLSPVTQHRMSFKDSATHAPSNAKHVHQVWFVFLAAVDTKWKITPAKNHAQIKDASNVNHRMSLCAKNASKDTYLHKMQLVSQIFLVTPINHALIVPKNGLFYKTSANFVI